MLCKGYLIIRDSFFGFMAFLGAISLLGIVINNAIVEIDRIQIEEDLDKDPYDAIMAAALQSVRPILFTILYTLCD